jgi:hypothetical protein
LSNLLLGQAAFRGRNRETFSESRMREMRLSGSMSEKQETEPCQTGLRRALRKQRLRMPPGDYRYCADEHLGDGRADRVPNREPPLDQLRNY